MLHYIGAACDWTGNLLDSAASFMSLNTRLLFALLDFPLLVYAVMAILLVIQSDLEDARA